MRERPNRHAWRACVGQPTVGSNPTPSATLRRFGRPQLRSNGADPSLTSRPRSPIPAYAHRVDDEQAMVVALDEAERALGHDDVPVGAVALVDGDVMARRHNE